MSLNNIFTDKTIKPKEKTALISNMVLNKDITVEKLIEFAENSKDPAKATCIEAIEFASQTKPELVNKKTFDFVTENLKSKAPRVKWESAKVIGNTAHLFQKELDTPIVHLLENTEHSGTVVRWSSAFALGEIIKLKTSHNKELVPAVKNISDNEEKNSIKKIYQAALKKIEN